MFSYRCSRDRKYLLQILMGLRGAIGGCICCQQLSEHTLGMHLVLERMESAGSQHTAVLLGYMEQSEAESVANNYRNTPIEG